MYLVVNDLGRCVQPFGKAHLTQILLWLCVRSPTIFPGFRIVERLGKLFSHNKKERAAEQRHAGKVNGMSFNVDKEAHEEKGVK